jgi:hypothetical protein
MNSEIKTARRARLSVGPDVAPGNEEPSLGDTVIEFTQCKGGDYR